VLITSAAWTGERRFNGVLLALVAQSAPGIFEPPGFHSPRALAAAEM
jgi:hypothetical protein